MERKYRLILERQNADATQTLGTLYIVDKDDRIQYKCWSLELPPLGNQKWISRIPAGEYKIVKRWSKKYGDHLHVQNVKDRTMILIHSGNTYKDTKGCILVGDDIGYINGDEHLDVLNSKKTLGEILELLPQISTIDIVEYEADEPEVVISKDEDSK